MAPTTLEELQARHKHALEEASRLRGLRRDLDAAIKAGQIPPDKGAATRANLTKKIKKWGAAAAAALEAINELRKSGEGSDATEEAADDSEEATDEAEETEKEPEPTVDEVDELKDRADEACANARAWAAAQGRTTAQNDAACAAARDAVMDGKTDLEAAQAARLAADAIVTAGPTFDISGLISRFGTLGDLKDDAVVGAGIADAIGTFFDSLGVTPEVLMELKTSPINRDKAAQVATGVSIAAKSGLGLLYSIGIITEVASLGQIDTLVDAIDSMLENLGIGDILRPLFTAPAYAGLTLPVRQYWMKQFRPTIPPIQDLRLMAVREAFPVETRKEQFDEMEKWGGYLGLDEYWRDRYLIAGYERMDVRTALAMYHWRLWDDDQLTAFLKIADIHPDDHKAILATLWRSPTRYERRHGYIMGVYGEEDLEEYFHRDGLSDADAVTATAAMTAYALNSERNAVARAAGRVYREIIEEVAGGIRKRDDDLRGAEALLEETRAALKAAEPGVTKADVDHAEEEVEHAKSALGSLKRRAASIRETAEAELRSELKDLKIDGDRRDLWVRRYYMEARIKTRPWEIIEAEVPEVPFEPEG